MLVQAFTQEYSIRWYFFQKDGNGRCPARDFLDDLEVSDRDKVISKMETWAEHGDWNNRVGFIKQVQYLPKMMRDLTVYEVKSYQERLLFIRCDDDAVALDGTTKKDDWSKKDDRFLKAAGRLARRATNDHSDGRHT